MDADKQYSMYEAIADIALQIGHRKFISINSRLVIEYIIEWATEFEEINKDADWGINTDLDYMEAIEQFADLKIKEAISLELGYIDS